MKTQKGGKHLLSPFFIIDSEFVKRLSIVIWSSISFKSKSKSSINTFCRYFLHQTM